MQDKGDYGMKKILAVTVLIVLGFGLAKGALAEKEIPVSSLPFSAAREAGNTLYLSGQIPVRSDGSAVREDITAQTHQTMQNLQATLEEHGYTWDDVVKVTVYLSDMKHYQGMNAAYRTYFENGFPARECVGGLQLAFGLDMEISCIAYRETE